MAQRQGSPIRVLVVDDEVFFRDSLSAALAASEDISVVGVADNGLQARDFLLSNEAEVVLCDVRMPIMDGVGLTEELSARGALARVIAVTSFNEDQAMLRMLHAGAWGFVLKSARRREIIDAVVAVAAGGTVISPVAASNLRQYLVSPLSTLSVELSDRERSVLGLLHQGKSNRQIAGCLGVSEVSVKKTMSGLMRTFDVSSRVRLIAVTRGAH
ncbi:response regulator transcription factor [Corynebacterium pacaense]|uniref:response regulator transcription factor n=1 Tax=Corynebacterium pacaense TaxID=1816684 RepID=UPI0009B9E683|nr:response regulator transcription factor [Corynebacterium pacaense]